MISLPEQPMSVNSAGLQMRSRLGPWQALAIFVAAWLAVDAMFEFARDELLAHLRLAGLREIVAVQALSNIGIMWVMFAVCVLILRLRGQKLGNVGWRRPASTWAWLLAVGVAILFSGAALGSVGGSAQLLSDWSFYRISLALVIGASSGICSETIFRGFVMTQARDAGVPLAIQILMSAVLFDLAAARFGWVGTTGHPNFWLFVATHPAAVVLGGTFAIIYVVGRRSLTPVIVGHAAIDIIIEPGMLLLAAMGGAVH
jgi:hypothetical protein